MPDDKPLTWEPGVFETVTLVAASHMSGTQVTGAIQELNLSEDPQEFIGAELRGIVKVDTNRTARRIGHAYGDDVYLEQGEAMFVDIETDRGVLQFVAYNAHNGYYGHDVTVESRQLHHSAIL